MVVLGASGAGKDSVLAASQPLLSSLDDVCFVRRVITRRVDANDEAHDSVTVEQFMKQQRAGEFALTWQAHGLYYGVPAGTTEQVQSGSTVILNGSRGALNDILNVFPSMRAVYLEVDDAVLAERLAGRGRETTEEIQLRLERRVVTRPRASLDCVIENNSALEQTVDAFVGFVKQVRADTISRRTSL